MPRPLEPTLRRPCASIGITVVGGGAGRAGGPGVDPPVCTSRSIIHSSILCSSVKSCSPAAAYGLNIECVYPQLYFENFSSRAVSPAAPGSGRPSARRTRPTAPRGAPGRSWPPPARGAKLLFLPTMHTELIETSCAVQCSTPAPGSSPTVRPLGLN